MKFIKNNWPVLFLFAISTLLFVTNYQKDTWLLGWDNIMPELNISLNFKRAFFAIWQDYRGLGLPDGMAHAANLMHTLYIFLLSSFIPQNMLRISFLTLTHLAGGVGFFYLSKSLLKSSLQNNKNKQTINLLSLFGSLFYMLNLGIIQMYYAPLEVFAFHFAALPILALTLKNVFEKTNIKNIFILFTASLLLSPQAFVPTLFIVFLILFSSFTVVDLFKNHSIKKVIIIAFTIFAANAFWLLPYSYTALSTAKTIQQTRINQFSSEEIFYRNKAQGDILSVLSGKGFMLDSIEYDDSQNTSIYLMQQWRTYYNQPLFRIVSILFIVTFFAGIFFALKKRQTSTYPYLISVGVSFLFLANNTPVLAQINDFIRQVVPVLGEAFRFPFTKFITLFFFCFSIFLTFGIYLLIQIFTRLAHLKERLLETFLPVLFIVLILILSLPAFQGYFYSPLLKVNLPNNYLEVFKYFKTQDKQARIALLPAYTFWNWQYRNWGHIGSGFDWYGIEQPILERAFDPWSLDNEQFYNELSHAINKNDQTLFNNVLNKYKVSFLLLDKTIQNSTTRESINYPSLENFLIKNPKIKVDKKVNDLIVYKVENAPTGPYLLEGNLPSLSSYFKFTDSDTVYNTLGNYKIEPVNTNIFYPFPSFFTGKLQSDLEFSAKNESNKIVITSKKETEKNSSSTLILPSLFENEFIIPVTVSLNNNNLVATPIYPELIINDQKYRVQTEAIILGEVGIVNPTSINFVDSKTVVAFNKNEAKGYIFNKYKNILRIRNDRDEEQIFVFNTENITNGPTLLNLPEEKIEKIQAVVEKIDSSINVKNVISQKDYEIKKAYDSFKIFNNRLLEDKQTNKGIELTAQGNSSIDLSFYKANLPHRGSYMMFATSSYKKGLPVSFYVQNPFNSRPEVETKLSKTNSDNVIVLPSTEEAFNGYGFHFTVKSVGQELSQSTLENISLFVFPQNTLSNIKILYKPNETFSFKKQLTNSEKINSSLYTVSVPKTASYLVLPQAYDKNWKAYEVKNKNSMLHQMFPFILGKEVKQHIKVNNWENAWLIEPSKSPSQRSFVIVYLPQYLEYAGFGLIIILIATLMLIKAWHYKQK